MAKSGPLWVPKPWKPKMFDSSKPDLVVRSLQEHKMAILHFGYAVRMGMPESFISNGSSRPGLRLLAKGLEKCRSKRSQRKTSRHEPLVNYQ